jgi:hypothetical protein
MSRLKSWLVFPYIVIAILLFNFSIQGNHVASSILNVVGLLMLSSWYVMVGHELYQLVPPKIEYNYNLFIINFCMWVTSFGINRVYAEGNSDESKELP